MSSERVSTLQSWLRNVLEFLIPSDSSQQSIEMDVICCQTTVAQLERERLADLLNALGV